MTIDALLRSHGWQIVSRPATGPPTWKKGTRIVTEERAYALSIEEERRAVVVTKLPVRR